MESGTIINCVLLVCATLNFAYAMNFFRMKENMDKSQQAVIFAEGITAFLWSFSGSCYGFSVNQDASRMWTAILIWSFDFYMVAITIFIQTVFKFKKPYFKIFIAVMAVIAIIDGIVFGLGYKIDFFRVNGRSAYYFDLNWRLIYHFVYILLLFATIAPIVVIGAKRFPHKRNRISVYKSVGYNLIMMVLAIPDTLLPLFKIVSLPTSSIGVTISFILMIHLTIHNNTISISKKNLSNYIFNLPELGILVFDEDWNLSLSNNFAIDLLMLPKPKNLNIKEIFKIDNESILRIERDLPVNHHFKSLSNNISLAIDASIAKDKYGDPYCYILVISDMTYEEQSIQLEKAQERRIQIEALTLQTVKALANAIDAKDSYTNGHSSRVSEYSEKLAVKAGLDKSKIDEIRYAGLLHDIGKIGIPDSILKKPGKLTDEEFSEIQKHPVVGASILANLHTIPASMLVAKHHHERFDGTGYPNGLKGEEIPLEARITCIADAYDAMNSSRVYRPPLAREKIRSELVKGRGTQFDPELLDNFLELFDTEQI